MGNAVIGYVGGIEIFFAALDCRMGERRHVEACIGHHLRDSRPQ
jgi:hypothetical protein